MFAEGGSCVRHKWKEKSLLIAQLAQWKEKKSLLIAHLAEWKETLKNVLRVLLCKLAINR